MPDTFPGAGGLSGQPCGRGAANRHPLRSPRPRATLDGDAERVVVLLAGGPLACGHDRGRGVGDLASEVRPGCLACCTVAVGACPVGLCVGVIGPGPQVFPGGLQRGRACFQRRPQVVSFPRGVGADLRDLPLGVLITRV